jgi:hypothetical protein
MKRKGLREGSSMVEVSLSLGILIIAGAVGYYFLYFLPHQSQPAVVPPAATPTQPAQTQPTQPAAPTGFQTVTKQIGQPFVVDGVQYTVTSALNLGDNLSKYPTNMGMGQVSGGTFILVEFTADNVGQTQVSLNGTAFFVIDQANGAEYRQEEEFPDDVNYSPSGYSILDQQSYDPTSAQPGIPLKLYIITEAPAGAQGLGMVIANQKDQNYVVPLGL